MRGGSSPLTLRRRCGPDSASGSSSCASATSRRPRSTGCVTAAWPGPMLPPILFALVIAPALKDALHTSSAYEAYIATGTIGLLIPLNTMFAGLSVLVERESGAQRELLAAPVPRPLLVLGNLIVAFGVTALQIGVLIGVARARGIHFDVAGPGLLWFLGGAALFTVGMYGAAESLAARVPRAEEYIS